jgi:hypothetical protein
MKPKTALDRSVLLAEFEAEQRRNEGIIFSAILHVLFVVLAINFNTVEKWLNLSSQSKKGNTSQKIEISLIEIGQAGGSGATAEVSQIQNEALSVAVAPNIEKLSEQTSVQNTKTELNNQELSQAQPSAVQVAVDKQADVNQKTKKEKDTATITQAQVDLKQMRERQEKIQREIDESLKVRREKEKTEELANKEIANLVSDENESSQNSLQSGARVPADNGASGESGVAFMDPEAFRNFQNQFAKGGPQTGSSQFVVNIKQFSNNTTGQQPCPTDRTYHNPADQCRPYTQKLYQPLCMYEYNDCLELMQKYNMKRQAGDTVEEE